MTDITTHGACGKSWVQSGNRTGHCARCHETFSGVRLFDWHQQLQGDGSVVCLTPDDEKWQQYGLFYDADKMRWHVPWDAREVFNGKEPQVVPDTAQDALQ